MDKIVTPSENEEHDDDRKVEEEDYLFIKNIIETLEQLQKL